jgi:hypothetical protein
VELHERSFGATVVVDVRMPVDRTLAHTTAIRAGVTLKLLNATDRLRELLVVTTLDRFIDVAASERAELGG